MDPIRTAVKYALSPLRLIVHLGDEFVSQGEERRAPQPRAPQPRAPRPAARAPRKASRVPKDLDDVGLARKVETIIFRDDNVPKGHIDVNAANGVVWLRGQAKTPEMIKVLVRQCAAIPEVRQGENLLHLPKTPAPTRT
jgi:hypothetical protein